MAAYNIVMRRTASTTLSLGDVTAAAGTPRRHKWYDVVLGSEAVAADNPFLYIFQRHTAAGTRTAFTPLALDPADAAFSGTAGVNHTVEPTYTANALLLEIALNQRATFRWQTDPSLGLVVPATASNGIGIQTPTSAAIVITASIQVQEQ